MKVKLISVDMKNGTTNVVFVVISHKLNYLLYLVLLNTRVDDKKKVILNLGDKHFSSFIWTQSYQFGSQSFN